MTVPTVYHPALPYRPPAAYRPPPPFRPNYADPVAVGATAGASSTTGILFPAGPAPVGDLFVALFEEAF